MGFLQVPVHGEEFWRNEALAVAELLKPTPANYVDKLGEKNYDRQKEGSQGPNLLQMKAQGDVDVCVVGNHVMHYLPQVLANIGYQLVYRVLQKAFLYEDTLNQRDEP